MKLQAKIAVVTGILALTAAPAFAAQPEGVPPADRGQGKANPTPGPKAGLPAKAKAYGRHCKGESKEHVKGEKGTAFSRCVTAMAKAANGEGTSPRKACNGLSKKHVKGEKGTEFSRCVVAAAKLKREQRQEEQQAESA